MAGDMVTGPAGGAERVDLAAAPSDKVRCTVAAWFLNCPGQSAAWSSYALYAIHLRPEPGLPEPELLFPAATHQVVLVALDPDPAPSPDITTWVPLWPTNLLHQIAVPNDEAAAELLRACAEAVVNGMLWAEAPLSGQREPWVSMLDQVSGHFRLAEHAGGES